MHSQNWRFGGRISATLAAFFLFLASSLGWAFPQAAQPPEKAQLPAKRQILAIGGGGLEKSGDTPLLMKYFLELTGKKQPRVCFMPAASGDSTAAVSRWNEVMKGLDCVPKVQKVYIASPKVKSFETELLQADAIFIGGGNALNMLVMWKVHGIDKILRLAYDRGIVLGGEGAGSICWFEQGSTDSRPAKLTVLDDCLGFLKGSNCADYDGNKNGRPTYKEWIKKGEIKEGVAADNGVGLHFVDEKLFKVVSTAPKAQGYRVTREGDKVVEAPLPMEVLGK